MARHLNDQQWTRVMSNERDRATTQHLDDCHACRVEKETLERVVRDLRSLASAETLCPESFWQRQRNGIQASLDKARAERPRPTLAWAAGAIAAACGLAVMLTVEKPLKPHIDAALTADHILLVEIERSLQRNVPTALEPAAFLTEELGKAVTTGNRSQGERQ